MSDPDQASDARQYPGVYASDGETERLVHLYQGGFYKLSDIFDIFGLGEVEESEDSEISAITLDREEIRTLKTRADAFSFDYEEPFIEMMLEMHRFAQAVPGETVRFVANFIGDHPHNYGG